jgi:hypothetical protein
MRALYILLLLIGMMMSGCQEEEYCWGNGWFNDDGNWVASACCNDDCFEAAETYPWDEFEDFDDELEEEEQYFLWGARLNLAIHRTKLEAIQINESSEVEGFVKAEIFLASEFLAFNLGIKPLLKPLLSETFSADVSYIRLNDLPSARSLIIRLTRFPLTGPPSAIGMRQITLNANEVEDVQIEMEPYGVWISELIHGDIYEPYSSSKTKRVKLRYEVLNNTHHAFEKVEVSLIVLDSKIYGNGKDFFEGRLLPFNSDITSESYEPYISFYSDWVEAEVYLLAKVKAWRSKDSKFADYQNIQTISFRPQTKMSKPLSPTP